MKTLLLSLVLCCVAQAQWEDRIDTISSARRVFIFDSVEVPMVNWLGRLPINLNTTIALWDGYKQECWNDSTLMFWVKEPPKWELELVTPGEYYYRKRYYSEFKTRFVSHEWKKLKTPTLEGFMEYLRKRTQ